MGDFLEPLGELLDAALQEYGVLPALLIVFIVYQEYRINWQYKELLKQKNGEIVRLSGERNKLQNLVLGKRLSTQVETKNDGS